MPDTIQYPVTITADNISARDNYPSVSAQVNEFRHLSNLTGVLADSYKHVLAVDSSGFVIIEYDWR